MLSELEIVELKKKSDVDAIADYVKKMCGGVSFVELECACQILKILSFGLG